MCVYRCHNTKHVRVPLSQQTCACTTIKIQSIYTYRCHKTKYVRVPLSQHQTCACTTIKIQNMYTYRCHNTKQVPVPLSQHICIYTGKMKQQLIRLSLHFNKFKTILLVQLNFQFSVTEKIISTFLHVPRCERPRATSGKLTTF